MTECHDRGALLVAAVFEAFLSIYRERVPKPLRIATGAPAGDIHPDLVDEMARTAARVAGNVLRVCVRALDHCPPLKERGSQHIIFRGGCTLLFDLDTLRLRYAVAKDIDDRARMVRQFQYQSGTVGGEKETYFASTTLTALAGPFAVTHSHGVRDRRS